MRVDRLWLTDFRNYTAVEFAPAPGLTVVVGANGEGKTNLLEAVAYLATLQSFRGAPREALIREGCSSAVVRASATRDAREVLETELNAVGRDRVQVNRQALRRARDLLGSLRVTVFAPDDLALVKAGPQGRRDYLDEVLVALHPKHGEMQSDLERILRQRNTLLRQAGGLRGGSSGSSTSVELLATLDVWDERLADVGERVASERASLVKRLEPEVGKAYDDVAHTAADVGMKYQRSWAGSLAEAIVDARDTDLRRAVTSVGPHRDELVLTIGGLPARTHASQGEQRSLALALKLAAHRLVADDIGEPPVLLLDDVFSELDASRSDALLHHLPEGQALLTTAGSLPEGATPDLVVRVAGGRVHAS
jgi:DNA replication and repair protein RecF